ncbi:MAG TPA: DUF4287 domain-containing protein [Dehalococcoidia bacterium]
MAGKEGHAARAGGVSDAAVRARTGKGWAEWFAILDAAGAVAWGHKETVRYLREEHGVPDWWCQMVTVGYEQGRGKRAPHQTPEGYQVGASKTVDVPLAALYAAWADPEVRARWLPDAGFTVRKATQDKSLRVTWVDGRTNLDVNFSPKGEGKSQVSLQHSKLEDAAAVERLRAYWREALERLKAGLETGGWS